MKLTKIYLLLLILALFVSGTALTEDYIVKDNPNPLSDEIVRYLNEKYFPDGVDLSKITFLKFSEKDMQTVNEAAGSKLFHSKEGFLVKPINIIVDTPNEGKVFLGYKNNQKIKEKKIDADQEFALTKLYEPDEVKLPELPKDYKLPESFSAILPEGTSKETKEKLDALLKFKKGKQLLKEYALLTQNIPASDLKFAIYVLENLAELGFRKLNEEEKKTILFSDADLMPEGEFYNNVFYALKARKEMPWCQGMTDDIFKDYVLPHRCSEEQMFSWRARWYNALAPVVSKMNTIEDARKFASSIYNAIIKYRYDVFFEDQGPLTLMLSHEGRCEEMTNFENRMFMSIGIPSMHVYTPAWAGGDGNHAWSGYYKDNKLVGAQNQYKGAAKVYTRNGYGVRKDVTTEFGKVVSVTLEKLKPETDVLLNVWNHNMWVSVARYKTDNEGKLVADNIGANKDFWLSFSYSAHSYYNQPELEPIGKSFFVNNGEVQFLEINEAEKVKFKATLTNNEIKKEGKFKILAFKNFEWVEVYEFTASEDKTANLEFESINTIFVLANEKSEHLSRPFIIDAENKIKGY